MGKTKSRGLSSGVTLLVLISGINAAWSQKTISINNNGTFSLEQQETSPVLRSRAFEANPQLQNFSPGNAGDTLLLDFFSDKHYKAVVLQVSKSSDGITGITAQVASTAFGYCYISVAGNDIALSAELPQKDEFFSVRKINGKHYLAEQTLSKVQHEHDGEYHHAPESSGSAHPPTLRAVSNPTLPESSAPVTVDILVVYTPAAKAAAVQNDSNMELEIAGGIQRANQALANSQTNLVLNLVHKQEVDYTESNSPNTDLVRLRDPEDGYADEAHALRTRYNADLMVLLLGESGSSVAGAGYIINNEYGNPKAGFSVVKARHINNGYVLIHEIGHNFGCGHHTNTDTEALYSYSHGYGGSSSLGNFSTTMTYENVSGPRIPFFSDPDISYGGVATGSANANNAKTIRQTKGVIAAYSDEVPWTDAFLKDITLSDGALSPAFNPGVYQYTVDVDNSVTSIGVQGIVNSPYAAVSGNVTAMALNAGSNTVKIEVEDGWQNYTKTYTVTVNRDTDTAIETIENSGLHIRSANGMIHVDSSVEEITAVSVYGFNGVMIKEFKTKAHQFETANPHGIQVAILLIETSQNKKYSKKVVLR